MRPSSLALAALGLVSGAAAIAAAAEGCALPAFTLAVPPDGGDAGADAGPLGCVGATYPDPPLVPDDGTSIPGLVFALHSIDMGDNGDVPGYDLDHTCTCFDDAGSSCSPYSAQISMYCDTPPSSGIDNQAAKLFQLIALPLGKANFGSDYFSAEANAGAWSLLVQVDQYNGMPDDPSVSVSLFPSNGLHGQMPKWDGTDTWPVIAAAVGDGGVSTPMFVSSGAYVAGGVLVASMPTSQITLAGGGPDHITVRLTGGVLTAQLVQNGPTWSLKGGIVAARWSLTDVFGSLSSYRDNQGMPVCTNQIFWSTIKGAICNDADILTDDTAPKSSKCDAISVGLGFTADPALLGPISDAGLDSPGCAPGTDPSTATCP